MKKIAPIVACLALSGCNSINNEYVDANGRHGSGKTTFGAMQENVKFSIADSKSTCTGRADSWRDATLVMPVTCTNGKSGTVTMTRPLTNASVVAGEGTIQFKSGETKRFIFGPNKSACRAGGEGEGGGMDSCG